MKSSFWKSPTRIAIVLVFIAFAGIAIFLVVRDGDVPSNFADIFKALITALVFGVAGGSAVKRAASAYENSHNGGKK